MTSRPIQTRLLDILAELRDLNARRADSGAMPIHDAIRYNDLLDAHQAAYALPAPGDLVPGQVNGFIDALRRGVERYARERGWALDPNHIPAVVFELNAREVGASAILPTQAIKIEGSWRRPGESPLYDFELPICYVLGDEVSIAEDLEAYRASLTDAQRHGLRRKAADLRQRAVAARAEAERLDQELAALLEASDPA